MAEHEGGTQAVLAQIQDLLDELEDIETQAAIAGNIDTGKERLKRWHARAIHAIAQQVSAAEGDKLKQLVLKDQTFLVRTDRGGGVHSLQLEEQASKYRGFLAALHGEIAQHGLDQFAVDRTIDRDFDPPAFDVGQPSGGQHRHELPRTRVAHAQPGSITYAHTVYNVGDVMAPTQIGGQGNTQNVTFSSGDRQAVQQLVDTLRELLPQLPLAEDDRAEVEADIATITSQLASPRPKPAIIRGALDSVQPILLGVAGNIVYSAGPDIDQKLSLLIQGIRAWLGS